MRWYKAVVADGLAAGLMSLSSTGDVRTWYRLKEWQQRKRSLARKGIVL